MLYYMGYYRLQNREGLIFMRNIVGVVFNTLFPAGAMFLGGNIKVALAALKSL